MICSTKADKKDLVLITIDDALTMSYLLGNVALEAYLPSYPVDDGTFGVYPEMYCIHTWESMASQGMEVSKAGVVMGIAPLLIKDGAEEGTSGEVKFFYQMLLDDGTLCLVRSFATRGNLLGIYPDGSYISDPQYSSIPGWVAWVKGKRALPRDKHDLFVADYYARKQALEKEPPVCDSCHQPKPDVREVEDPYVKEVNEESVLTNLCDDCMQNRMDDI